MSENNLLNQIIKTTVVLLLRQKNKTDEETYPDNDYKMSGNKIGVHTLDLNVEFSGIWKQLDGIADRRGYMSRIVSVECKCAICGATNEYRGLASTNTFGGPDLDLRPAEMKRSTMHVWIQECPECGYISEEVSDPSDVTREWLLSEKYLTCDGILFESDLAKQFYKYYLINLEDKNPENAFFAVLHAAWACDDKNDDINAKHCRELAISLATKLIEGNHNNKENIMLMRADLMRRTGQFETMINAYASVQFDEELLNQILRFEVEKAKEKNTACYRVEDVTGKE